MRYRGKGFPNWRHVLAVLLLTLTACSAPPTLPRLPTGAVVLAFGDSLTYGTGADDGQSYPAVLAALTGRRVVNAGVPGEVSAAGLARLPAVLEEHRPQLLILCHGGNDLLRKRSDDSRDGGGRAASGDRMDAGGRATAASDIPVSRGTCASRTSPGAVAGTAAEQELTRNLRAMVEAAHARGIAVVLVGVPAPGLLLSVPDLYAKLAQEQRLPYEAETLRTILGDRALKSDPIHPNAEGYRKLAQRLHALLREAGAL